VPALAMTADKLLMETSIQSAWKSTGFAEQAKPHAQRGSSEIFFNTRFPSFSPGYKSR
jgi:hypothetical protein